MIYLKLLKIIKSIEDVKSNTFVTYTILDAEDMV